MATVYIPTLNGGEPLERCLASLQTQTTPVEVVVADNGTGRGCTTMLAERFPDVIRIGFGRNLGFGSALNRAIAAVGEGPIILLNDDAVAEAQFAEKLLADSSRAEMVAAVLLGERDISKIDSAGVIVDQTLMGFDYLSGSSVDLLAEAGDPLGPTGGAALYSRKAFDRVGGFDEHIFLYYEDVDLALRMRASGATCVLSPDARAIHGYSVTLGPRTGGKYAMTGWSRGYLLRRYGVTASSRLAPQALARDAIICAGQLLNDRTTAGLKGRIKGWHAAKGLERRLLPASGPTELSLRQAMSLRRRRHTA